MLQNFENYGPYNEGIKKGQLNIQVKNINKNNYESYYNGIVNILRDGIEEEYIQNSFVKVNFSDGNFIELTIIDYTFNIIMWDLLVKTNITIEPKHIYFEDNLTGLSIKKYIDKHFIDPNRKIFKNMDLNNIIDDTLYKFLFIDEFNMYLANTINLEDTIDLMNKHPEVYDILHKDLNGIPLEEVKKLGMEYTNKFIEYIKNSDHCLSDTFKAGEGVNVKQFKEFAINIGTKPDGQGGVYPAVINNSFINGGMQNLLSNLIESSTGRTAQILSKRNVASSGHFARLLRTNNMDTFMYPDHNYKCDTKNLQKIFIKDSYILKKLNNRYYKLSSNGLDHIIKFEKDSDLVGKTILLYSPMTCASRAAGNGICYRCYGDLAHTNNDINIGVIAAEELSSKLTQILLSAKHLLDSLIKKFKWTKGFNDIFEMEGNVIKLFDDFNYKGHKLLIDPNNIYLEEEFEDMEYNEYITEFEVEYPDKSIRKFCTSEADNIYIDIDLNNIIRHKAEPIDGMISIDMNDLRDSYIFVLQIQNNELSATLDKLKALLNKDDVTTSYDRDSLLQKVIETVIEGNLNIDSIHLETILSNQLRDKEDILEMPKWEYPNEPYEILTLNKSLTNNPSITISLSFEKLAKALYNPLSYRKHKPSFLDLFFIEKPTEFINSNNYVSSNNIIQKPTEIIKGLIYNKKNKRE